METFVSAVLSDFVSRSVSLIVDKYYTKQKGTEENLQRLSCLLLRIQATVEEADGRQITNQAMMQQLHMLREEMYKGFYLLDTFRYRVLQQKSNDQVGDRAFLVSSSNPTKRMSFSTRRMDLEFQDDGLNKVQKMLGNLHSIMDDMAEFIVFLKFYSPISREPYNMYLFLENCIFGRQAEMEKIISFLLQPESPGADSLQVLPIIGPSRVGKSTLVEHVCYDERVRNHFSSIILCSGDPTAPDGRGVVKKKAHSRQGRSLLITELADDLVLEEEVCRNLSSLRRHMPPGTKVIITSRSENIVKHGSTGAIRLAFLSQEAYWYFFKVMAFGSTNPGEHPELASIAMEIATELDGSFLSANIFGYFLRANMHKQFWRKVLELERKQVEMNLVLFGERPHILLRKNQPAYIWSPSNMSTRLKVLYYQTYSPKNEVSTTILHEVRARSVKSHGKLDVLRWKSRIPPYHSYSMTCEMEAPQLITKKKRLHSTV